MLPQVTSLAQLRHRGAPERHRCSVLRAQVQLHLQVCRTTADLLGGGAAGTPSLVARWEAGLGGRQDLSRRRVQKRLERNASSPPCSPEPARPARMRYCAHLRRKGPCGRTPLACCRPSSASKAQISISSFAHVADVVAAVSPENPAPRSSLVMNAMASACARESCSHFTAQPQPATLRCLCIVTLFRSGCSRLYQVL